MRFGPRYAAALTVDAIGAGLLRPFLVVYGLSVLHLSPTATGFALSAGLLAGLLAVPATGRWIDAGTRAFTSRVLPVVATLVVRAAGVGVLLAAHGTGTLRIAAFGVAALAVAGGPDVLRLLAAGTALGYATAAVLVLTVPTPQPPSVPASTSSLHRSPGVVSPAGRVPGLTALVWANVSYVLCFAVLEVVLPVVLTDRLGASPAWPAILFAGNTVLVVALQVHLVVRLRHRSRRGVLAVAGVVLAASYLGFWASGALESLTAVCVVAVAYTLGEILYAGSGTALVTAAAPHRLGHALARWQLSTGVANAAAPALLLALLATGPALLWPTLAATTLLGALAVHRWAPEPLQPKPVNRNGIHVRRSATIGGKGVPRSCGRQ